MYIIIDKGQLHCRIAKSYKGSCMCSHSSKKFVLRITMEYMYSKLKLNAMSDTVYQFFIQQFIGFVGYEIKRKSSLVESIVAKLVRYFIFTSVYKIHSTEIGYIQRVLYIILKLVFLCLVMLKI